LRIPVKGKGFSVLLVLMLSAPIVVQGESLTVNGFIQGNYSAGSAGSNPDDGNFKWAEERVQLKANAAGPPFYLFAKADLSYDHVGNESAGEVREAYIDYLSENWDVRAGRQIITWGVGDLVFINDLFPKDYEAYFSGRPIEYLKIGSDAFKMGIFPDFASIELVVTPFFEPDNFPSPERFHMFDPMPWITDRRETEPATTLNNAELAVRMYRGVAGFDISLYYYRGFFRQPSAMPDNPAAPSGLAFFHPELSVYGASLQGRMLGGVVSLEAGYYDSREDRNGDDPVIPNSRTKFLAGFERQIREDFTAGIQYFGEYLHDYSRYEESLAAGFPKARRLTDLVTLRLTRLLFHQTLKLSVFAFYGLSDGDYLINPEVRYGFTDNVWAAVGGMVFGGGSPWSQFGGFDDNDNLYLQCRYEF